VKNGIINKKFALLYSPTTVSSRRARSTSRAKGTDTLPFFELVRGRENDRWTSAERRQKRVAPRPVVERFEVLANFHSAFGERLGRSVQYSDVRHLDDDRRYRALNSQTATQVVPVTVPRNCKTD